MTTVWEGPANVQALEVLRLLGNRYPGFAAFVTRIEGITDAAPPQLSDVGRTVGGALDDCRDAVDYVSADGKEGERHARRLMSLLADTMSLALLLEEASRDLAEGDARKAVVARLYATQRFDVRPRRGIGPGNDLGRRQFAPLVAYGRFPRPTRCDPRESPAANAHDTGCRLGLRVPYVSRVFATGGR